jgi:hypothetical protein
MRVEKLKKLFLSWKIVNRGLLQEAPKGRNISPVSITGVWDGTHLAPIALLLLV